MIRAIGNPKYAQTSGRKKSFAIVLYADGLSSNHCPPAEPQTAERISSAWDATDLPAPAAFILRHVVLLDGPTARGAATSWRVYLVSQGQSIMVLPLAGR
jgi:hypothetical protein